MIVKCDFCTKDLDTRADRWLFQDDGSYIHIDCIEPALEEYKELLDNLVPTDGILMYDPMKDFKLLSKLDPREPFISFDYETSEETPIPNIIIANWKETCEWCGHITQSPNETHVCQERI